MKKVLLILLISFLLFGCKNEQNKPDEPIDEPINNPINIDNNNQTSINKTPLTDAYIDNMIEGEVLHYLFLGTISTEKSLQDVLDRAKTFKNLSFIEELNNGDIYNGLAGDINNVYLLVPNKNTKMTIGQYSYNAGDIVREYYYNNDAKPIIFIESGESTTPLSLIKYECKGNIGQIYTGFNYAFSRLRTDYHMGVIDLTPYEEFTSSEVPSYRQGLFDALYMVEEIKNELDKGNEIHAMDEMIHEGEMYVIYSIEINNEYIYYLIRYDTERNIYQIYKTTNFEDYVSVAMG